MSLASVGVLLACMLLMGNTILLSANLNAVVKQVENTNDVLIYLNDGLSDKQVSDIGKSIKSNKNISECTFVSKEQALEDYKKRLGKDADILNGLDQNPLPNAYKVKLKDLSRVQTTVKQIEKITGVLKVTINNDFTQRLIKFKSGLNWFIFGFIIITFMVSMFIIMNTVKIALFIRKREINIMKYVGATNWFIRWPFLIEGMILGFGGAFIAVLLLGEAYNVFTAQVYKSLAFLPLIPRYPFITNISIFLLVIGTVIGALGSTISLKRFMRV
jgi:cell division transport system permease protein